MLYRRGWGLKERIGELAVREYFYSKHSYETSLMKILKSQVPLEFHTELNINHCNLEINMYYHDCWVALAGTDRSYDKSIFWLSPAPGPEQTLMPAYPCPASWILESSRLSSPSVTRQSQSLAFAVLLGATLIILKLLHPEAGDKANTGEK